ncbi:cupin domain-containing protein [Ilumatobacter nonamiensis]|uniref:cupin domain-containing protein n=1 Tax=Ilumatobacter nonamiensis TaxID=467093 RepID=UPI00058B4156|nr:cupin domain-containing protein [Ilumatobacter nonamiensis]
MSIDQRGFVMAADSLATWFLDTTMRVLARNDDTGGAFTFIHWEAPTGFGPPRHVHPTEDEAFYLVTGTLDVVCGDDKWTAGPGDFVFLPKGIPHAFVVTNGPVEGLQITSPAGFEDYVAELGRPATSSGLPEPTPPDHEHLMEASERFGYLIVGPPMCADDDTTPG